MDRSQTLPPTPTHETVLPMSAQTGERALALIDDSWRWRREAFDAPSHEKELAFAKVTSGLSEAATICRTLDNQATLSVALRKLGHAYLDLAKLKEARALMAQAVVAARKSEDPLVIAHTVWHLGDVEVDAERFEEAEEFYQEALALYKADTDPPPLDYANCLRRMAILKEKTGAEAEAKQLWAEARPLYAKAGIGDE